MRARRVGGVLGRILLAAGFLVLSFAAYQLWGTNLTEASHQSALRSQFEHRLSSARGSTVGGADHSPHGSPTAKAPAAQAPAASVPTTAPQAEGGPPATAAPVVAPPSVASPEGSPLGVIAIPKIGLSKVIVEGTGTEDLRTGPGHYPGTPLPGQAGNAAIAGHRTTYGAPFYNLNELAAGDQIVVTTLQGKFRYDVTRTLVVDPSDVAVVAPTSAPTLTLTTCNPRFSAAQRLVVQARLMGNPLPPSPPPTTLTSHHSSPSAISTGLGGAQGDWTPALWWGLGLAAAAALVLAVARRVRSRPERYAVYVVGVPGILAVLFFFFENVSPLLPASI